MKTTSFVLWCGLIGGLAACSNSGDPPANPSGAGGTAGGGASGGAGGSQAGRGGSTAGSGGVSAGSGGASAGSGGSAGAAEAAGGGGSGADASGGSSPSPTADAAPTPDGGASDPSAFVGTWEYDNGQEKLECPGSAPIMGTLVQAVLTFETGSDAPLLLASPTCTLRLDIEGNKTVLRPGQTCTGQLGTTPVTFRPQTFTFEVTGQTAQQSSLWNVTRMPAGQPEVECTLTAMGTLTRQ